ncbi:MAG: G1 family glutamic endopeptidase, partial [Terriglobales bacterium]
ATYGFPPRPDKQAHPDLYAHWERAMKVARIHWNGELKALPGGLKIPAARSPLPEAVHPEASGPKDIQTNNASGVIVASGQKSFNKNSIGNVFASITVPTVEAPMDNNIPCSGQGYVAIATVGIDGFVFDTGNGYGFDPQLEGGVYEQLSCSGDIYYFAVFGYQGNYNIPFSLNPGDVVYMRVATSGGPNSFAYLQDNTTGIYGSYSVTTSGIVGKTANWMVERLCCSGNEPITLANTTSIAFGGAFAGNETDEKIFYAGSQASTTEILAMTDDKGDETIEDVTQGSTGYEGRSGLWFETTNCAAVYGCTP